MTTFISIPMIMALAGCQAQPNVPKEGDDLINPAGNSGKYAIIGEPADTGAPGEWEFIVTQDGTPVENNQAFLWDFGGTQSFAGARQRHTFASTGPAVVSASALSTDGSISFTVSDVFHIIIEISLTLNEPPVADAGPDVMAESGATVRLDGSGSYDPEQDDLAYTWEQIAGADVQFITPTDEPILTFYAPVVEQSTTLTFRLTVNDGKLVAKDTVLVDLVPLLDSASTECPVKFSVELLNPSQDNPFEGYAPLTVECSFASIGEADPPEGTYTWRFDDEEDSGSVRTQILRTRVFESVGIHSVALMFTMVGAATPVSCVSADDGATVIRFSSIQQPTDPVEPPPNDPTDPTDPPVLACEADADCDDGIDCTVDACDVATFTCVNTTDDAACGNGRWCDGVETCDATLGCQPGAAPDCDDDVDCTVDSCNEATDSCKHLPDDDLCDNGLWCDGEETCHATLDCQEDDNPCAGLGGTCDEQLDACVAGHTISGTLTLVQTLGARPKFGQHDLLFTGSGASSGHDFIATTEVDGTYTQVVPVGWTGTVSAADPTRMFLRLPGQTWADGDDWTFGTGSGADAPPVTGGRTLNFEAWTAPIGLPGPEFGIKESHHMYAGKTFDFGSGPVPYPDAGYGPYTHYVDNTHPNATDTGNTYGTPSRPRVCIPFDVPAGSVVEIHGGPYFNPNIASPTHMRGAGTAAQPIFYRGYSEVLSQRPVFGHEDGERSVRLDGTYLVVENINFDGAYVRWHRSPHHLALRHCQVQNTAGYSGVAGVHYASATRAHDVVVYDNDIRHCGDVLAEFDEDAHGVAPTTTWNCFVLDNELSYCSGDGVQVHNAGISADTVWTHHIYIGRNRSHSNKQSGIWVKKGTDMVISQNVCYDLRPMGAHPSSLGTAFGAQYAQSRIWWIFNEAYDCDQGIRFGATEIVDVSTEPATNELFVMGNYFHDINHTDVAEWTPWSTLDTSGRGYAILARSGQLVSILGNTVFDCEGGIAVDDLEMPGRTLDIRNNLISNSNIMFDLSLLTSTETMGRSFATQNLFHSDSGAAKIRWHEWGEVYSVPAWRSAYPAQSVGTLEAAPKFVNPATLDLHLRADSPALDSGDSLSEILSRFEEDFGVSIDVDFDGRYRPLGSGMDIGAFERPR